ncbi:MAG: hypothetical protein EXS05_20585 [Planctomycetaceae bacterium]|nr:hypothetical protein [Planctomycetaceae bacterium]
MRYNSVIDRFSLLLATVALFSVISHTEAGYVNFETLPGGGLPTEGLAIGTTYLATQGMSFSVVGAGPPLIVERGSPRTGFLGYDDGVNSPLDQPAPGQGVGDFYINTNNLVVAVAPLPFIVSYAMPAGRVSGVILDIDNDNEYWRVVALNSGGIPVGILFFAWDDPVGVGNGIATLWSFARSENDIASVRLEFIGTTAHDIGYAFDNFSSSNIVPEPSTLTLLVTGLMTIVIPVWRFRRSAAKSR